MKASGDATGTPIDIIPFGGVESETQTIAWPPRRDVTMNVAGFEEALESSVRIRIEDNLVVCVASIPGLAVLKLLAWQDRRHENNKDATRICHQETRRQAVAILASDQLVDQLIQQMHQAGFVEEQQAEWISNLLKRFSTGFLSG